MSLNVLRLTRFFLTKLKVRREVNEYFQLRTLEKMRCSDDEYDSRPVVDY